MRWLGGALLFGLLGTVTSLLVLVFELDPSTAGKGSAAPTQTIELCLLLSAAAIATVLAARALIARPLLSRVAVVALAFLTFACGLFYLYGQRGVARRHYAKFHDSFHYTLGAKYFREVGYLNFYDCAATAHSESQPRWPRGDEKIRDLRTYRMIPARQAIARTDCLSLFGGDRWREFKSDVVLFNRYKSVPRLLTDHGYNGSPTHTFFASHLANTFELSYASVTSLALIDVCAITAMLAIVAYAFGAPIGLLFAALFFVNFSDRFYFIGGSMMRYVWLATLVSGISMLRLGRYRTAGVLMTSAGLLNVFPILFLLGVVVRAGHVLIRTRTLPRNYRRFIGAGVLTGLLGLGLGASHGNGANNYGEFLGFIGGHSQKLTSSRTGLRFVVLYRGQSTKDEKATSYRVKVRELLRAAPFLLAFGAALLLAGIVLCLRLDDVEASCLLGFLAFFVIFGTVEYYYAATPILLLTFHKRWKTSRLGAIMVASPFALMVIALALWRDTQFLKFCNNTVMSAGILSLLCLTLVYLAREVGLVSNAKRIAAALLASALIGPAIVLLSQWIFSAT